MVSVVYVRVINIYSLNYGCNCTSVWLCKATVVSLGDTNIHHLHLCELHSKFPVLLALVSMGTIHEHRVGLPLLYLAGAALSFGAGAVFGWTFGQEFANHWLQLYRLDAMAAQVKFLEWWEKKSAGRA